MNLSEAIKISTAATDALDAVIGSAQLLLARKRQEREARMVRYETVVTIMEAESKAADDEIAELEKLIYGGKIVEPLKFTANAVVGSEIETPKFVLTQDAMDREQEAAE